MFYGLERLDKDTLKLGNYRGSGFRGLLGDCCGWRILEDITDQKRWKTKLCQVNNKVRVESVLGVLGSMPEYAMLFASILGHCIVTRKSDCGSAPRCTRPYNGYDPGTPSMLRASPGTSGAPSIWFGHGCSGQRVLLEHERNYGLGMDALVTVCFRNTNVLMVWAWMLW